MNSLIDSKVTQKLSYGLFVLTAKTFKHSGCIINTAIQVTSDPFQVSIAVNKSNYTLKMILESKKFNLSILSEKATFDIFKRFGFQSGETIDKFENFPSPESENGLKYISADMANSFISAEVVTTLDLDTHYLIIGKVTESKILSDIPSATCAYYFKNIKPKPEEKKVEEVQSETHVCNLCGYSYVDANEKAPFSTLSSDWSCPLCGAPKSEFSKVGLAVKPKVYVCTICGYEYDELKEKVPFSELPDDWVCPLCKHPKSDLELKR